MNDKLEFYYPTLDDFIGKLRILLKFHEKKGTPVSEESITEFSITLNERMKNKEKPVTMRTFTAFILRYLFEDNCLIHIAQKIKDGELN
jgi:hypothetical protein